MNAAGDDTPTEERATLSSKLLSLPVISHFANAVSAYSTLIIKRSEFRWLWIAGIVSTIGNFFTHIAIVTIIERVFKDNPNISGTAVSAIFVAGYIPPIILMPLTGVLADVLDRRKVMLCSDLMRMVIVLLFSISLLDEKQYYYVIYIIEVIMWSLNSFFDPVSLYESTLTLSV
jgi:MFS family permease